MRTLEDLWQWAYLEGKEAALEAPDKIHAKHPYPEKDSDLPDTVLDIKRSEVQNTRPAIIVGPPFTRAFVRYLDGARAMTPIRRALIDLKPKGRPSLEFRILWAIVEGGHPTLDSVAAIERASAERLRPAAYRALSLLWDKTQRVRGDEPKRMLLQTSEPATLTTGKHGRTLSAPRAGQSPRHRTGRERVAS